MGVRWYDSQLSRWLSADTIIPDPANPQSFNRFAYVYNNALRYIDPTGHQSIEEFEDECGNDLECYRAKFQEVYAVDFDGWFIQTYLVDHLAQCPTGRKLLEFYERYKDELGFEIMLQRADEFLLNTGGTANFQTWSRGKMWVNWDLWWKSRKGGFQGSQDTREQWTAKFGHEIFHLVLDDFSSPKPGDPAHPQDRDDFMNWRITGRIWAELTYPDQPENWQLYRYHAREAYYFQLNSWNSYALRRLEQKNWAPVDKALAVELLTLPEPRKTPARYGRLVPAN